MFDPVSFRRRVLARERLIGTHLESTDAAFGEILGHAGFDYIWIDTEHTAMSYEQVQHHILAVQYCGAAALVRVHINDLNHTTRILEMGPAGVIFPMVSTPEQADAAMRSCLYPPVGIRGFGPKGAARYGHEDLATYVREQPERLARFIQLETELAVRNLREIVRNPLIDGYIFGPVDLSGSIGVLPNYKHPNNLALIREAVSILQDNGKCIGLSIGDFSREEYDFWAQMGINMISTGGDYNYATACARNYVATIRAAYGKP